MSDGGTLYPDGRAGFKRMFVEDSTRGWAIRALR
jgi:hypothetical protein